jgi:hypothetical protein
MKDAIKQYEVKGVATTLPFGLFVMVSRGICERRFRHTFCEPVLYTGKTD